MDVFHSYVSRLGDTFEDCELLQFLQVHGLSGSVSISALDHLDVAAVLQGSEHQGILLVPDEFDDDGTGPVAPEAPEAPVLKDFLVRTCQTILSPPPEIGLNSWVE